MRNYTDEDVLQFIKDCLSNEFIPSLREIARNFNTSHSQIKRVLMRLDKWYWYLELKENINEPEEEVNDVIDLIKDKKGNKIDVIEDVSINNITVKDLKEDGVYVDKQVIKKVGFITDIHLGHHDQKALDIALSYLKDKDVDILVVGGDVIDNESVSFWKNKGSLSLKEEILLTREFIKELRNEFLGEIYWLESNHYERLEKYILSKSDKLISLDELKLENLLKFKDYDINFISNKKLMKEIGEPFKIGKLYYLHGHEVKLNWGGVNIARSMFLKTLENVIFGHFHRTQEYKQRTLLSEMKGAWSVGCLCNLFPDYNYINNWNHGFAYIEYYDDGSFVVFNKIIQGDYVI